MVNVCSGIGILNRQYLTHIISVFNRVHLSITAIFFFFLLHGIGWPHHLFAQHLLRVPGFYSQVEQSLESRYLLLLGQQNGQMLTSSQLNYWANITESNVISGSFLHGVGSIGMSSQLIRLQFPMASHRFGVGYHMSPSPELAVPFGSFYAGYTGEFDQNTRLHISIAKDDVKNRLLTLLGIDIKLGSGNISLEWDGEAVILGYRQWVSPHFSIQGYVLPVVSSHDSKIVPQIILGFSLHEVRLWPFQSTSMSPSIKADASSSGPTPPLPTPLDYGLEDSLRRLNQANEYFYAGQYELARIEMEYLVTVFPTSGSYSRLGSIYFKLNNKNKAIENWRRAYALDKSNAELDAFIKAIE